MTEDNTNETADGQEPEAIDAPTVSPEDARREIEKLRKEAAKYRTRAKALEDEKAADAEAKKQAALTAEERAVAAEKRAAEAQEAAEARVLAAERKAALTAVVTKPDRVLKLGGDADEYWNADGTPNADAILRDFSEYAPDRPAAIRAAGEPQHTGKGGHLKPEDFRGKSQAWIEANLTRLRAPATD